MTAITLPPLPEPDDQIEDGTDEYGYVTFVKIYSRAQVEQIRRDAVLAALGAANEVCMDRFDKRAAGGFPREAASARACADAIRALMPKEEGK